jgi:aspartate 1-decarboxylase
MLLEILKSKIHRAVVTSANLEYIGSITVDAMLMERVGIYENEKVHVLNINNGQRAETYVIKGERGKGEIVMNGALARLAEVGDRLIILAYGFIEEGRTPEHLPKIVVLDEQNHILETGHPQ